MVPNGFSTFFGVSKVHFYWILFDTSKVISSFLQFRKWNKSYHINCEPLMCIT